MKFIKTYRYSIIWALFILFACGAPTATLEDLKLEDLFSYDKPIHAILFGMQAYLIITAKRQTIPFIKLVNMACFYSAVYGILVEVLQKFLFIGRAYDYWDMLANTLGCLVVWIWFWRKRKQFAQ